MTPRTATPHLAITLDRPAFRPGEAVTGSVQIAETVDARALTVALEYRDWTSDYHSVGRTVPAANPLGTGTLQAGMSFPFAVTLPSDPLPNQSGEFGSASWGVHARADRRGIDYHAWHVFELANR